MPILRKRVPLVYQFTTGSWICNDGTNILMLIFNDGSIKNNDEDNLLENK